MSKSVLAKYWWTLVLRGIVAILFALLCLFWTKDILNLLVILFGVFILIEGLVSIFGAVNAAKEHNEWWIYVLRGLAGIILALMVFFWPEITAVILVYFIAIWAIVMGAIELFLSSKFVKEISMKWILTGIGVFSLVIGLIILFFPYTSLLTIVWVIGLFTLISGIGLIAFGLQVKKN